jgi:hypothetical protein
MAPTTQTDTLRVYAHTYKPFSRSPLLLSKPRKARRSALASAEYNPCFHRARLDRSSPSRVRGPVLAPPCMRHRPLRIAGALHSAPDRVLAPHRGAWLGSPGGLLFFSQPFCIVFTPESLMLIRRLVQGANRFALRTDASDNRLSPVVHMHMLHDHLLFTFRSKGAQNFDLAGEHSEEFYAAV